MTHLSPPFPVHITSKCSRKTEFQTTTWCLQTKASANSCAFVLGWGYYISRAYQIPSIVEVTKWVQPKIPDHKFLQLWSIQTPISLTYLFRYSLISIHSVKNSTRAVVITNTLWWNALMFYHLWCRTNASSNNPLFSSNCRPWLMDVYLTWPEENILSTWYGRFHQMQRHVRWHVNKFHIHIHQRPYNGCLSKLCHDGCDGRESGDKLYLLAFQLQCLMRVQAGYWMPILQRSCSLNSWLHYFRYFS